MDDDLTRNDRPTGGEIVARLGALEDYDRSRCLDEAPFSEFFSGDYPLTIYSYKARQRAYGLDGRWIFKHYHYPAMPAKKSRYWEKEARALERLDGLKSPRCLGYIARTTDEALDVLLCRELIPGEMMGEVGEADIDGLAGFFAAVHAAGVTTDDPNTGNFLRTANGLAFIDYEWATTHDCRFKRLFKIGKELVNVELKMLPHRPELTKSFLSAYQGFAAHPPAARLVIGLGGLWWRFKKCCLQRKSGSRSK